MRHGQQGFTLLELLVVIAIIGLMASMASWFTVRMLAQERVQEAATTLALEISRAHSRALSTSRLQMVKIEPHKLTAWRDHPDPRVRVMELPNVTFSPEMTVVCRSQGYCSAVNLAGEEVALNVLRVEGVSTYFVHVTILGITRVKKHE